jgi:hypothetical protein
VRDFRRKKGVRGGGFLSFWFFFFLLRLPVEMWEIPEAVTAGSGYESTPQPRDG